MKLPKCSWKWIEALAVAFIVVLLNNGLPVGEATAELAQYRTDRTRLPKTAPVSWVGRGDSSSWNDPKNWSTGKVPGAREEVRITRAGTYAVTIDEDTAIRKLVVGGSSGRQTLNLKAGLSVSESISNDAMLKVDRRGRLTVDSGAYLTNAAYDDGQGLIIVGEVTVNSGATFTNKGKVRIEETGTLVILGKGEMLPKGDIKCVDIWGTVRIGAKGTATNEYLMRLYKSGKLINHGRFEHRENSVIEGSGFIDNTEGTFECSGVIRASRDGRITFKGELNRSKSCDIDVERVQ